MRYRKENQKPSFSNFFIKNYRAYDFRGGVAKRVHIKGYVYCKIPNAMQYIQKMLKGATKKVINKLN